MSLFAIPVRVALLNRSSAGLDLETAAAALNEQIQADFAPAWHVKATVAAYTSKPPAGTWQVIVEDRLDQPGALGYHTDAQNQPVAYVEATPDWTVTVSHETLEMLADPWGNRMHAARLPQGLEGQFAKFGLEHAASRVHYLLEVCDPPEATSYEVGGSAMSDFLLPHWYRSASAANSGYSHAGGCIAPRQVAEGGYVSFANSAGEWYQAFCESGQLQVQDLGKFDRGAFGSLRAFADFHARARRAAV